MTSTTLQLAPEPQRPGREFFAQPLQELDVNAPTYRCRADDASTPLRVFLAPTPETALQWICKRVPQDRLLAYIAAQYAERACEVRDSEDDATEEEESRRPAPSERRPRTAVDEGESDGSRHATAGAHKSQRKRGPGRETSTKQANKRLKEKLDQAMLHEVASTQDWVSARSTEITVNDDEMRYKRFAQKMQGAGVAVVGSMINKAAAIGTLECLKEWRTLLTVWRAQHRDGRPLFAGVDSKLPGMIEYEDSGSDTNADPFGIRPVQRRAPSGSDADNEAQLSEQETDEFAEMFLTARRSRTAGIIGDMRHRWIMAAMYTRYEALETLARKRQGSTGGRGRGFATIAKEHLFRRIYSRPGGNPPSPKGSPVDWKTFSTELESGKRWCMLKARFGLGIFALLPRSVISNNFIERGLTMTRFTQWIDMIATCNTAVAELADAIEETYVACMMDCPPPERMLLEELTDVELAEFDALTALSPLDVAERAHGEGRSQSRIVDTQLSDG